MTIEQLDPLTLDEETADQLARIGNALARAHGDPGPPMVGAGIVGHARFTHANRPVTAMWLARDTSGELVGHATYETSPWDNPQLALIFVTASPDADLPRVTAELLEAQLDTARRGGQTQLMTFTTRGGLSERCLVDNGFEVAQLVTKRRLRPRQLDFSQIESLATDAAAKGGDYELVRLDGPTPDAWLSELRVLFEAMNDAPLDAIDVQPEEFSDERIHAFDLAMAARHQHVYRLLARHRRTGDWAGHTILVVDGLRPGVAFQEDTTVVSSHRGHRLGMLLKASMLLWMRVAEPTLEVIDTWNADTNSHMIAVNVELGCEVVSLGSALQRKL